MLQDRAKSAKKITILQDLAESFTGKANKSELKLPKSDSYFSLITVPATPVSSKTRPG